MTPLATPKTPGLVLGLAALCCFGDRPVAGQSEIRSLDALDADTNEYFGQSVDTDGVRILIGTPGDNQGGVDSGAAYLFDLATGAQLAKLTASDAAAKDAFGTAVALGGNLALVGAPGSGTSGAAYLFDATTGAELHRLSAPAATAGAGLGRSVDVDGTTAIAGAPFDKTVAVSGGAAFLFSATTGAQLHALSNAGLGLHSQFGTSVAVSGNRALVGAPSLGAGEVFAFDTSTGASLTGFTGANQARLGKSMSIDGDRAAIGAPSIFSPGSVHVVDLITALVVLTIDDPLADPGTLFADGAIALHGDRLIVGARDTNAGVVGGGVAWVFDSTTGALLFQLEPSNVGPNDNSGTGVAVYGDTYVVGVPFDDDPSFDSGDVVVFAPETTTYCTAKVNSQGCAPAIAATGFASISGLTPYDVSATNVLGLKTGILFYGLNGPTVAPFLGGTLCVQPPLRRTPTQFSGGGAPDDCSGTYSFDFQLWLQSGADPALAPGVEVNAQYWGRDPSILDGSGSSLSNAVEFTVGV